MYRKILLVCALILVSVTGTVMAQGAEPRAAFRDITSVSAPAGAVPVVVEVPFVGDEWRQDSFLVIDKETGSFLPHYWRSQQNKIQAPLRISGNGRLFPQLSDGKANTNASFLVSAGEQGVLTLDLHSSQEFTTSGIVFNFDKNVIPPQWVTVSAVQADGTETIVLARTDFRGNQVLLPKVTTNTLRVVLEYYQPLRINEISLLEEAQPVAVSQGLRFLAAPGREYEILLNPDRSVSVNRSESGNLRNDTGVVLLGAPVITKNPQYTEVDSDSDGIPDKQDNCPTHANPDQADIDGNGTGDICDDHDRDGVVNSLDNCPSEPNRNQRDEDGDGIGDVCDDDESRITEKYAWALWLVMALAGGVMIGLFVLVARRDPNLVEEETIEEN